MAVGEVIKGARFGGAQVLLASIGDGTPAFAWQLLQRVMVDERCSSDDEIDAPAEVGDGVDGLEEDLAMGFKAFGHLLAVPQVVNGGFLRENHGADGLLGAVAGHGVVVASGP